MSGYNKDGQRKFRFFSGKECFLMSFDPYEFDRDYNASRRLVTESQYTAQTFL